MINEQIKETISSQPGWCSIKKAETLHDLIVKTNAKVSVELGCFGLRAGIAMAAAHKEVGGMYFGIDAYVVAPCLEGTTNPDHDKYWSKEINFEDVFARAEDALKQCELTEYATILKLRTDEAVTQFTSIDVLFVDANFTKECTKKDVEMYAPLIPIGGYLVMNNFDWDTKGPAKKVLSQLGFEIENIFQESCCGQFGVYKNTGVAKEEPKDIEEKLEEVTKDYSGNKNVYDPYSQNPCHPIPETPVDIVLRGGQKIGPLTVQNMLLYLPDTPSFVERWQNSMAHFKEAGLENIIEVAGIHGVRFGINGERTYDVDNPGSGYKIGPGYTAQFLSVYMLYSIANTLPFEHFLFLECDAKLKPDFLHHLAEELHNVPTDFDWLWIGSCCAQEKAKKHIKGNVYEFDRTTSWPNCGHCFIVSKKCLPYVIQTQRDCYAPSDLNLMYHTFPNLKTYGILPRLADQFNNNLAL